MSIYSLFRTCMIPLRMISLWQLYNHANLDLHSWPKMQHSSNQFTKVTIPLAKGKNNPSIRSQSVLPIHNANLKTGLKGLSQKQNYACCKLEIDICFLQLQYGYDVYHFGIFSLSSSFLSELSFIVHSIDCHLLHLILKIPYFLINRQTLVYFLS